MSTGINYFLSQEEIEEKREEVKMMIQNRKEQKIDWSTEMGTSLAIHFEHMRSVGYRLKFSNIVMQLTYVVVDLILSFICGKLN